MTDDTVVGVLDRALGTTVRVLVTGSDRARLAAAKQAVDGVVSAIDLACSRFASDSELVRLNACAGSEITVSPLLGSAIATALRAAQLTDGDVDPTVGSALRHAGYHVDFASVPLEAGPLLVRATPVPGWRSLRYSDQRRAVLVPRGVEIDLGATAKALAADLAAARALDALHGEGGVLVSLGGDIAVGGMAPRDGWVVQLSEDSAAAFDAAAERVVIRDGGLATSSTRVRRWVRGGVEQHHIIDPATGEPARTPWHVVSVAAATCVDANIASTCAIIRGHRAPPWLEERRLPARLVDARGRVTRVAGWPEAGEL
ncbi:MAG: FAD:protein FMN transferase [Candidatus Dormibacteria bacterium]